LLCYANLFGSLEVTTKTSLVTANRIVRRYRLSYQTLNYYTTLGLLSVAKRNGNERLYNEREVEQQLQAIDRLKNEGYPLRLITRILSGRVGLPTGRNGNHRAAK